MNPRDATPAPFSSNCDACKLLAVPVALVILMVRFTPPVVLATAFVGVLVAFLLVLLATPLHAERRHDAEQRRIFRDFEIAACAVWRPARYCAAQWRLRP